MLPADPAAGSTAAVPAATPRQRPRIQWTRNLAVAIAISLLTGGLISIRDRGIELVVSLVLSAAIGVTIVVTARLLFLPLAGPIDRLPRRRASAARTAVFAISGLIGWFAVQGVAVLIFRMRFGQSTLVYVAVTVCVAVIAGFGFYTFEVLRSRPETSVARVKEVEFAEKELQLARELQGRLLPPPEVDGDGY